MHNSFPFLYLYLYPQYPGIKLTANSAVLFVMQMISVHLLRVTARMRMGSSPTFNFITARYAMYSQLHLS